MARKSTLCVGTWWVTFFDWLHLKGLSGPGSGLCSAKCHCSFSNNNAKHSLVLKCEDLLPFSSVLYHFTLNGFVALDCWWTKLTICRCHHGLCTNAEVFFHSFSGGTQTQDQWLNFGYGPSKHAIPLLSLPMFPFFCFTVNYQII